MNQATEIPVLNWYGKDNKMIKGLANKLKAGKSFVTIRLGSKWANKLDPLQRIAISISDDPAVNKIIGYARVVLVKKVNIENLSKKDLARNIGAKTKKDVWKALESVYKMRVNYPLAMISVLELSGEK